MAEQSGKPRSFEERMEALTMSLELTVHSVESMRGMMERMGSAMSAMQTIVESHDGQIGQLISLAQLQNDRITKLEGTP